LCQLFLEEPVFFLSVTIFFLPLSSVLSLKLLNGSGGYGCKRHDDEKLLRNETEFHPAFIHLRSVHGLIVALRAQP
jgi:hypothetical protein